MTPSKISKLIGTCEENISSLEAIIDSRNEKEGNRSERWQESEAAELWQEKTEKFQLLCDAMQEALSAAENLLED